MNKQLKIQLWYDYCLDQPIENSEFSELFESSVHDLFSQIKLTMIKHEVEYELFSRNGFEYACYLAMTNKLKVSEAQRWSIEQHPNPFSKLEFRWVGEYCLLSYADFKRQLKLTLEQRVERLEKLFDSHPQQGMHHG